MIIFHDCFSQESHPLTLILYCKKLLCSEAASIGFAHLQRLGSWKRSVHGIPVLPVCSGTSCKYVSMKWVTSFSCTTLSHSCLFILKSVQPAFSEDSHTPHMQSTCETFSCYMEEDCLIAVPVRQIAFLIYSNLLASGEQYHRVQAGRSDIVDILRQYTYWFIVPEMIYVI